MIFGRLFHDAIDNYFKRIPDHPRPLDIETFIRQSVADKVLSELPQYQEKAERQMKNLIRFETTRLQTWLQFKPTFTERTLADGFLTGRVDAYFEADQTCIDWKTGGNTEIDDDKLRQNAIYRQLLNGSNYPVKNVIFFMLDPGIPKLAPATTKAWLDAQIEQYVNGKVVPIRGTQCGWCSHIIRCEFNDVPLWSLV
jgi:hypothetical protein